MNLINLLTNTNNETAIASRIYGVVIAIVTNNQDPEGLGRVKVTFPWLSDEDESDWARLAVPMAGSERGMYFLPEVEDEVLVAFEQGDVRFPYVVGGLWNGKDVPPSNNDNGQNDIRVIRSRSGHVIRLNDEEGKETIEIIDKSEQNSLIFDTASNTISIETQGDITLSAPQGTIKLDAQTIEIKSSADSTVEASSTLDLTANSTMNLQGQTINLN
ncbi:MAG: phage baseplate assembly protein V [Crocosphaera sp.]